MKKITSRVLSFVLVVLMLIGAVPLSVAAAPGYSQKNTELTEVGASVEDSQTEDPAEVTETGEVAEIAESEAYSLPYQRADGLYAYAGTEVGGTNAWQRWDSVNSKRYFYLPPTVSDSQVIILNTYSGSVEINGVTIPAGEYAAVPYEDGTTYTCAGATTQSVKIQKTDAEGTIFVNSAEGMTTVNDNSSKTETVISDATYDVYSFLTGNTKNREVKNLAGAVASEENGIIDDATIKKMKGRGNTTWDLAKKPFNITYKDNIQLDGMKGKKWSLLANAQDSSLMRNRLIYDISHEVGMVYACDSRFVDMFVNGDYKGSYQLTQKIELGKNTVMPDLEEPIVEEEVDEDTGEVLTPPTKDFDFVLEIDMAEKAASAGDLTFKSNRGQVMTHKVPDEPTSAQISFMKQKYNAFEDALYTDNMQLLETLIDIDDLARAYLINEIAKNLDGALTSCYFVYNSDTGKFYASPVWDYDNGVGNTVGLSDRKDINGNVLYITSPSGWYTREVIHIDGNFDRNGKGRTVFSQAWYMKSKNADNKSFADIAKELWTTEFADLEAILTGEKASESGRLKSIAEYRSNLEKSGAWNYSYGGWTLNNSTNNSWISNHSSLSIYEYDKQSNTLSKSTRTYNQTTFTGQMDYAGDWLLSRLNWLNSEFAEAEPVQGNTTIYFANTGNWKSVWVYGFYGNEGETAESEWPSSYPGLEMTFAETDENGNDIYTCKVPADIDFIKFSDNTSNNFRTNNVPNSMISENVCITLGSSAGTNKWNVTTYDYTPSGEDTGTEETTKDEEKPEEEKPEAKDSTFVLRGTFTSWTSVEALKYVQDSDKIVEAVYNLEAGEYKFKFFDTTNSAWYGNNGTITDATNSSWQMQTGAGNCTLKATGGTYTFRFNTSTKMLDITYGAPSFKVVFKNYDGTILSEQTVEYGMTATAPENPTKEADAQYTYMFKGWDTDFSAVTADIVVTAQYAEIVNKYTVIFKDYDGTVLSEQTVEYSKGATAPASPVREGYNFTGWDMDFSSITKDTVVTAEYSKIVVPATTGKLRVDITGGTGFRISVNGTSARPQGTSYVNTKMTIGATVTLVANAATNGTFLGWMNESGAVVSTTDTYTFTATGNDYYKAAYVTAVEGVNAVVFKNSRAAGGKGQIVDMQYYSAQDEIMFPDAPSLAGYTFTGWSMTEEEIQASLAQGQDVTVTANWERAKVYIDVNVTGGTITTAAQENGKYLAYGSVTVVADTAPEGQKFAYWADTKGRIMSYNAQYKFFPSADTALVAVFVAQDVTIEKQPLVFIAGDPTTDGEKITYTISWDIDASFGTVTNYGLIVFDEADFNADTFYHGSGDSKLTDKAASVKTQADTKSVGLGGSLYDHTYCVKSFVIYTDAATGNSVTIYSDMIIVYKPAP